MPELNVLTDLEVSEVSLVQRGANQKRIALVKSEDRIVKNATLKSALETACKLEDSIKLDGPDGEAARVALRALSAFDNPEIKAQVAKALGIETARPDAPKPTGEIAKADIEKTTDPEIRAKLEAVFKTQETQRVALEKAEASRVELEKQLANDRRATARKELVNKSELALAPGTPDEKADLILAVRDVSPELSAKLETMLATVAKQLGQSELFKTLGAPGKQSGARDELERRAVELRKSNTSWSAQKARVEVLKSDPALKARIREEA